jgi:hypothetical protein
VIARASISRLASSTESALGSVFACFGARTVATGLAGKSTRPASQR